ncbi:uncharacterized protein APUU_80004S [Aspergillus puulaauensis]|uniref:Uncharacterized protein n=1 Tax=Aspergillus puulaauensis TaxID=1220207 RepID=A0A7R7XXT1_9EURO|nr:uncharacterized protein APUU_80004S [Aspergillus puulaauensis]BCS29701.1 hypothetical protein APUU_80004S [Aspergillus puulaauensis]
MSQSVLKLTMFCEAACVTYKLLNNSNQLQLQPFSSGAGSQQQQLPVIDGHGYSSYQQQQQQQRPFYAFATPTPTLTPTDDPTMQVQIPAVVCEKRPMRLQSYLLDDEEAELLALQIVGAIAEKLSCITFTLQAWEFEFENERDAFSRGSAGPISRVSVEGIQARVGVLRRNLRSEGNRQSHTSDNVGIL